MAIELDLQETMSLTDKHLLIAGAVLLVTTISMLKLLVWSGSRVRSRRRLPPTIPAMPIIGGLIRFMRGPITMIREEYARLGSVFTLSTLGHRITFLIGPEVSEHLFNGPESEMSQQEVYRFTVAAFGRGVAFDVPYSVRQEQIRIFAEGLRGNKLRGYVNLMVCEAEEYFSKWGESGTVDLKHELEQVILLITCRCLLGREVRQNLSDDVAALFHDLCNGMQPVSVIFPYLPIPAHRRRDRARQRLREMFATIIRARKASGRSEEDMLQCLIDYRYKDGRATTEDEIAGLLITVLFGGQQTSSITSTWTGAYLLQFRRYLAAAVEEQEEAIRRCGDRIDHDVLAEMDVLHRCIKEALRLQPPLPIVFRWSHSDFAVTTREGEELVVPKGQMVAASPAVANRLPHVYKDPELYDPDRFAPGRREDKAAGALSYISFGGGKHWCLGEFFAYLEIKTVWAHLLRNFELELMSPFPENEWNSMVVGVKGKLMVKYTRRQLVVDGN
ncbi:obtusifoliol 14-alpha demethylase [Zea mays]|uniref:Obtusifoliol 14-alpha demethylase n=2 Tax=Zea mays TaxID=4577 RepID=A0A804NM00_MAIZE|nr:obtusifoliol 14-alpha demethylase [Zea mays]|eukprot:XP_020408074.1 obtusifoliol 14-alpha demethylase [Zea mays]